jgi:hypothetical protein
MRSSEAFPFEVFNIAQGPAVDLLEIRSMLHDIGRSDQLGEVTSTTRKKGIYIWHTVLLTYGSCSLTFASDKLIAISALARTVHPLLGSRYIAGLWDCTLVEEMTWNVCGSYRHGDYTGPSWSWASTNGIIQYKIDNTVGTFYPMINIVKLDLTLASEMMYGQVKSASIELRGQLMQVAVDSTFAAEVEGCCDREPGTLCSHIVSMRYAGHSVNCQIHADNEKDFSEVLNGDRYCMPLGLKMDRKISIWALILKKSDNEMAYQRVAMVILNDQTYLPGKGYQDLSEGTLDFISQFGNVTWDGNIATGLNTNDAMLRDLILI